MGRPRRGAVLDRPHGCGDRRPLEPPDLARMFFAYTPLRGVPSLARHYTPSPNGAAEEARAVRRFAPNPLSGIAQALRIHPDAERSRPLSDNHVDRSLGRHPYG